MKNNLKYNILFNLSELFFIFKIILWPSIKTLSSILKEKTKIQLKWSYYWISIPFIYFFVELIGYFLNYSKFFLIFQFIISIIFSINNGTLVSLITLKIISPIYKKYYKNLRQLPKTFLKLFSILISFFLNIFKTGLEIDTKNTFKM